MYNGLKNKVSKGFYEQKKWNMKILAIECEADNSVSPDYEPFLIDESKRAWELFQLGFFREMYFNENNEAVIILECCGITHAEEILASLPLVREGLIKFKLMELKPYTGFRRLFKV